MTNDTLRAALLNVAIALKEAGKNQVDVVSYEIEDTEPEVGVAMNAMRLAKTIIDASERREATVLHVAWPEGASATVEQPGDVSLDTILDALRRASINKANP